MLLVKFFAYVAAAAAVCRAFGADYQSSLHFIFNEKTTLKCHTHDTEDYYLQYFQNRPTRLEEKESWKNFAKARRSTHYSGTNLPPSETNVPPSETNAPPPSTPVTESRTLKYHCVLKREREKSSPKPFA